jgi:hypothetical protein
LPQVAVAVVHTLVAVVVQVVIELALELRVVVVRQNLHLL